MAAEDSLWGDVWADFELFEADGSVQASTEADGFEQSNPDSDVANYISRSHHYWMQVPLPPGVDLNGTNVLASLDDETLLGMSPSLLVHIQRTEASQGMQVVSPRAVTLGGIAGRTGHEKRTTDMFLVGSAASRNYSWPVVEDEVPSWLFHGEPIDSYPSDPAPRMRTVSSGILSDTAPLEDPVTKALLVGRALVDLQRRPDVMGSDRALSSALARAWGLEPEEYEDLAEVTVAPVGPLLRYAIRADSNYPTVNAPVHARKCISVGANTAGRELYGEHAAIDWRRMRVLAEAVFYMSSRLEGWTLAQMTLEQPPGNPKAKPNRPGILQMRPLPGSVWSFEGSSFRLAIEADPEIVEPVRVPPRIRRALIAYKDGARPIAQAADAGVRLSHARSLAVGATEARGEAIVRGYQTVLRTHSAFSARGRTSASAVRGFVFECLADSTSLPGLAALWLAAGMHETVLRMNLGHVLDATVTRHFAARMSALTTDMRSRLGVEAGRRGSDLDEWWSDMASALPEPFSSMSEGSMSWALALAHMLLHPPTHKWSALVHAMKVVSHTVMARAHLVDVRLPAEVRSRERSFQAGSAVARQLGQSYGAYYHAMCATSQVLAARMKRGGSKMLYEKFTIAGMMWDIRAKAAATVTLHTDDGTDTQAGTFMGAHGRYHITTAPYAAYRAWFNFMNSAECVTQQQKQTFKPRVDGLVSAVFSGVEEPMFTVQTGWGIRLLRYAERPSRLCVDIERTLGEILRDVQAVVDMYDTEGQDVSPEVLHGHIDWVELAKPAIDLSHHIPKPGTYWDLVTSLPDLEAQDVVDTVTRMDAADAAEIEDAEYASVQDLLAAVGLAVGRQDAERTAARDAVV